MPTNFLLEAISSRLFHCDYIAPWRNSIPRGNILKWVGTFVESVYAMLFPAAYLQNVTVFEKQVVSTDATAIKGSVWQSIATDLIAWRNVWGLTWQRFSVRLSLLLLSFWQLWLHVSIHDTVSLFFQTLGSGVRLRAVVLKLFEITYHLMFL